MCSCCGSIIVQAKAFPLSFAARSHVNKETDVPADTYFVIPVPKTGLALLSKTSNYAELHRQKYQIK